MNFYALIVYGKYLYTASVRNLSKTFNKSQALTLYRCAAVPPMKAKNDLYYGIAYVIYKIFRWH